MGVAFLEVLSVALLDDVDNAESVGFEEELVGVLVVHQVGQGDRAETEGLEVGC